MGALRALHDDLRRADVRALDTACATSAATRWRGTSSSAASGAGAARCCPRSRSARSATPTASVWLYDTFEGMTEPRRAGRRSPGTSMADVWDGSTAGARTTRSSASAPGGRAGEHGDDGHRRRRGCTSSRARSRRRSRRRLPSDRAAALDTDWYESTRHELEHLWIRLSPGGVLVIDDYGHWAGARRGGRRVLRRQADAPLLARLDYTGRVAVKPAAPNRSIRARLTARMSAPASSSRYHSRIRASASSRSQRGAQPSRARAFVESSARKCASCGCGPGSASQRSSRPELRRSTTQLHGPGVVEVRAEVPAPRRRRRRPMEALGQRAGSR